MIESEIKKIKRFVKMLMTIQDKNDFYFLIELTGKQSCEFQLQGHCETGRVIQVEQNNKVKEFNTFTAHNMTSPVENKGKKEFNKIKIKIK